MLARAPQSTDVHGTQGLMSGTMRKLGTLLNSGSQRHMCYLVLFVVAVFIALWWIISSR